MSQFQKLPFDSSPASEAKALADLKNEEKTRNTIRWIVIVVVIALLVVVAWYGLKTIPKL